MPIEQTPLPYPGIGPDNLPAIHSATEDTETMPVCPCCGEEYDSNDAMDVDGTAHCPDCVHTCENCEFRTTDSDELRLAYTTGRRNVGHTAYLCNDCCRACADCSHYFALYVDGGTNSNDEWICEHCADRYICCADCSAVVHEDYARCDEDDTLCRACYDTRHEDDEPEYDEDEDTRPSPAPRVIFNYSYKPEPIFLAAPGEKVIRFDPYARRYSMRRLGPVSRPTAFFGLEIECENIGSELTETVVRNAGILNQSVWYAKTDGSITEGAEFVSHPGTLQYWLKAHDFALMKELRLKRFRSYDTSTCGMHVHISRDAFTDLEIWKLLEFFKRNAELIERLSRRAPGRMAAYSRINGGPGGERYRSSQKLVRVIRDTYAPRGRYVERLRWAHDDRYTAINLQNKNTVEIRIFRGTLEVSAIKRNIALCAAFVGFARWTNLQKLAECHFVEYLKLHARHEISEPEATELLKWVTRQVTPIDEAA